MNARTVPAGSEDLLRRAITEVAQTGKGVVVTDQDEKPVAVILAPHTHRAQAVINREDEPATHLAIAEDERHTLMAQETRDHLSRMEAEIRRHAEAMAHIERVFRDRTASYDRVPEWITEQRKADIAQALRLVDAASAADIAAMLTKTSVPGHTDPARLRRLLAGAASEPATVYDAWLAASQLLLVARR